VPPSPAPVTTQLDRTPYVTAWLVHRLAIGIMGVAMPVILILGEHILFSRDVIDFPRASLSAYFYSGLSVIFTGTLVATGVFLITFKITHAIVDNILTAIAGVGALAVMSRHFARVAARWGWVHNVCAFLMVATAVAALVAGARGVQRVGPFSGLLLVELICTFAFGVSWLTRGIELRRELIGTWA
jgi:hypothetical protein